MLARISTAFIAVAMLTSVSAADWDSASGKPGLIPFWIDTPIHYTMIVFVNGSEDYNDVISLRLCDPNGYLCSTISSRLFSLRSREMLMFSTKANPPSLFDCFQIPVSAPHGYAMFRVDEGGSIHAFAFIVNEVTGRLTEVPVYVQDKGF
ncbi:MAG: hypothetical protein JW941_00675 [Candidatus Coatesbacteria bacterium]|nr:hypothetical protein [Candidatus Coatesbacteria bacterium]